MSDANRHNDEDKNSRKTGEFRVPPRTWLVWIAIFGGILLLMLFRDRMDTQGETLSQYAFFQKVESNLIVKATINYNPGTSPLTDIKGTYYRTDPAGKPQVEAPQVVFRTKARLTESMEDKLYKLPQFEPSE